MRVTEVRVWPVQGRHWPRFPMLFVEVYTDAGIVGLGESLCYQATGVLASIEAGRRVPCREGPVSDRAALGDAVPQRAAPGGPERDRDGAVGYRRSGRRPADLQPARRAVPR